MAETIEKKTTNRGKPKNSTAAKKDAISTEQVNIQPEELNLDTKVTVKSIADWTVGFARRADGYGDITISPKGSIRLSRNEIITQVQNGNKLFTGLDGKGSHATLIIEDSPTRIEVGFEDGVENKQKVFSDELVRNIGEFMMKAMGFMSDGTTNLFFPILSFLVIGVAFGIGSYAVIRRTELR